MTGQQGPGTAAVVPRTTANGTTPSGSTANDQLFWTKNSHGSVICDRWKFPIYFPAENRNTALLKDW